MEWKRRPFRIKIVVAAAIGVLLAGCAWAALRRESPPLLATSPAGLADIEYTVLAAGTLEASQLVSVGAQVSGQIESLKVKLGDRVKTGELVAEIDATHQENELRNARAALTGVRAQRSVQAAALKQAQLAFERQKAMLEQDATSRADYENAEATLTSTHAQVAALDAQIEQSSAVVATAQANLGYTKIRAPMDGTVVAVVAKEGQTVNAFQAAPTLVKLAKLDTMTVNAQISEADVIRVKAGCIAYFTILGNPQKRYYGKLLSIEPAPPSLKAETGGGSAGATESASKAIYYNGLFEVPNPDGELRISMTAQVSLVLAQAKGALTIPSAALGGTDRDGTSLVRVVGRDGKPVPRRIAVGIDNNVSAQVLSGLAPGERVVVGEEDGDGGGRALRGGLIL